MNSERMYSAALVRVRECWKRGRQPNPVDAALALEAEHITLDEIDALERLIGLDDLEIAPSVR